ncbi:unnamed protein product [Clavelina lepadiformis]|uniref:Peptidase S1 domain-containing protein n=1 Tax=Clavelina lepadiformis TaxID=159417 RepID=A0ABP0GN11_CLALP
MGTTDYRYPYQSVYADNFFCHSSYNSNTMDYDYSMLHLSQQAATGSTNKISTIYVADREYPSGTQALITGWGLTVGGGNNLPTQLQYGYTNLMSAASCRSSWGVATITDRMQCAGGSNAVDACQGDSGGPLAVYDGSYWVLVGNTSWGSPNCDTGVPSMWSKNYAVRDWIYYYSGV